MEFTLDAEKNPYNIQLKDIIVNFGLIGIITDGIITEITFQHESLHYNLFQSNFITTNEFNSNNTFENIVYNNKSFSQFFWWPLSSDETH